MNYRDEIMDAMNCKQLNVASLFFAYDDGEMIMHTMIELPSHEYFWFRHLDQKDARKVLRMKIISFKPIQDVRTGRLGFTVFVK